MVIHSRRRLLLVLVPVIGLGGFALGWRVHADATSSTTPTAPGGRVAQGTGPRLPGRLPHPLHAHPPLPAPPPAFPTGASGSIVKLKVDTLTRRYIQVTPDRPAGPSIPILVVLHGRNTSAQQEEQRDGFQALVAQGRAELVYPLGISRSWNAGGCCGVAAREGVNDVAFLTDLVAHVDPGGKRPIYMIGFSNGGRMTYAMACDHPDLVDGYAVLAAVPVRPCATPHPVTLLQIGGTADPLVPYSPGDSGGEHPPVTTQVAALRRLDSCATQTSTTRIGDVTLSTWTSCTDGNRVGFATYRGVGHWWPAGGTTTPGAAEVIWGFLTRTVWDPRGQPAV